jgi:hypothetical protein
MSPKAQSNGLKIFTGSANVELAREIAKSVKMPLGEIMVSRFSEGEIRIKINEDVRGRDVFLIQPTCPPVNDNVMELLIILDAFRRASARRITAPTSSLRRGPTGSSPWTCTPNRSRVSLISQWTIFMPSRSSPPTSARRRSRT